MDLATHEIGFSLVMVSVSNKIVQGSIPSMDIKNEFNAGTSARIGVTTTGRANGSTREKTKTKTKKSNVRGRDVAAGIAPNSNVNNAPWDGLGRGAIVGMVGGGEFAYTSVGFGVGTVTGSGVGAATGCATTLSSLAPLNTKK
ncbi:hypothetical protein ACH5RR_033709 [Cinchona calisaya]|uniref:Uncharacterized protein n=1 Tax=Cinchona calisaya TaxID=153742 RepID=A0ABD2YE72_9GENT